jgi:hypothetical protein
MVAEPVPRHREELGLLNKTPGVLGAIVDALADEPVKLIVAIGHDEDPERFGAQPDNVRREAYVPQPLVLEGCDAFVTHGGFNSVKEVTRPRWLSATHPTVARSRSPSRFPGPSARCRARRHRRP